MPPPATDVHKDVTTFVPMIPSACSSHRSTMKTEPHRHETTHERDQGLDSDSKLQLQTLERPEEAVILQPLRHVTTYERDLVMSLMPNSHVRRLTD